MTETGATQIDATRVGMFTAEMSGESGHRRGTYSIKFDANLDTKKKMHLLSAVFWYDVRFNPQYINSSGSDSSYK